MMETLSTGSVVVSELPAASQQSLYNLEKNSLVPWVQVAFAGFNYGRGPAISYAAGLPYLVLFQARRLTGWRPKSASLLDAILVLRSDPPKADNGV